MHNNNMSNIKAKDRILKAEREKKTVTNSKGAPIQLSADFLAEILHAKEDELI